MRPILLFPASAGLATLWLVVLCHLAAGPAVAGPEGGATDEKVVRGVLAGLVAREAETRERALKHLAGLLAVDPAVGRAALPRLKTTLRTRGPAERALAVPLLLRVPDPDARALWLRTLDVEVEADDRVLAAATGATRQVRTDVGLAKRLLGELARKRAGPVRRALLIEALGFMESPAVELVLTRPRPGEHWVEAAARALALGRRASVKSIPPLLALLEHEALAPRVHAWEGLVALTHRDLPVDPEAWKAWWAQQDRTRLPARPTLKVPAGAAPEAAGANARYAAKSPAHVPHYYGIPIPRRGSRVVFCLDASQSMYGHGIDQARRELVKTLMDLPATHAFEIVVFNERIMPWAKRLVRAHPVQKFLAICYLEAVEPTSYTNLYDAVETAFQHAGRGTRPAPEPERLDAVFLLSDGAPNRGRYRDDKRVIKHIGLLSGKDIPVNTIGAGEEVFPLLRAIARETGGRFVDAFE